MSYLTSSTEAQHNFRGSGSYDNISDDTAESEDIILTEPPSLPPPPKTLPSKLLRVKVLSSPRHSELGQVVLHPNDFDALGLDGIEPHHVQIANQIYRATAEEWMEPTYIGVQPYQFEELYRTKTIFSDFGSQCISASAIPEHLKKSDSLISIHLDTTIDWKTTPETVKPLYFEASEVQRFVIAKLRDNYFAYGQKLSVPFDKGTFNFSVKRMVDGRRDLLDIPLLSGNHYFGLCGSTTQIITQSADKNELRIMQGQLKSLNTKFYMSITPQHSINVLRMGGYPKMVDVQKIKKAIVSQMKNKPIRIDKEVTINLKANENYTVRLNGTYNEDAKFDTNDCWHLICNHDNIELYNPGNHITLIEALPKTTHQITFKVLSAFKSDSADEEIDYIDGEALKQVIRTRGPFFWFQDQTVNVNGNHVRIGVRGIKGDTTTIDDRHKIQQHWKLADDAEITLEVAEDIDVILISSEKASPLKEVILDLEVPDWGKRFEIPEEAILEALKVHNGKAITEDKTLTIKIENEPPITATVTKMKFHHKSTTKTTYNRLGELSPQTIVKLTTTDNDLKIIPPFPGELLKKPEEFLEKFNVGGMSEECIKHLQKIVLMRSKAKELLNTAGIKQPKGMLLAGPPGTGKTNLANQLGKILGIPESNIKLIVGSEIFNKYVGNSEKNVRKLFLPAQKEFKKFGDASTPYLLIIDEIDAMLGIRDGDSDVRNGVVNQFIGLADGLEQFDNIFIIGITNRPDKIDPAVIRPGRLNPTITIGMPNKEGRVAIFRIHTKSLKENNQLAADIDYKVLAELTENMTGADIGAIVQEAYMSWVLRIATTEGCENLENSQQLKLNMKDFIQATEKIGKQLKEGRDKGYLTMFS